MSDFCDDALENLYLYLDGELTSDSSVRIRQHITDCPPCFDAYTFEKRFKIVVRERLQEEVPEALMSRLTAMLRSEANAPGRLDSAD